MSDKQKTFPRLIEKSIALRQQTHGGILVFGPEGCGKTTTVSKYAKTIHQLGVMSLEQWLEFGIAVYHERLLAGEKPLLFDEWQRIPDLWNRIGNRIDKTDAKGDYFLTCSATPPPDPNRHEGQDQIISLLMRPLSLWESGESSGEVSLATLFTSPKKIRGTNKNSFADIAYFICRGGWPASVLEKEKKISIIESNRWINHMIYFKGIKMNQIIRLPDRKIAALRSYARHITTSSPNTLILQDVAAAFPKIDIRTINSYLNEYKNLFLIDETLAWSPQLKSKTPIRTRATKHFVDPSVGTTLLNVNLENLMDDVQTFDLLFNNLAIRDLKIYAQANLGKVFAYRDKNGLEVDAIVHLQNGDWGGVEIKIGGKHLIDQAAKNLLKLAELIDETRMKKPSFLMVLTAVGEYAYVRLDGVYVVPIGCLRD